MEASFGVQIVWVLSAQEAIVANFQYIEVEHLFNSILKFSELDEKQLKTLGQIPHITSALIDEKKVLVQIIRNYGIKVPEVTKPLRRGLRKIMGQGGYLSIGRKKIHRSKETRKVFSKAQNYAQRDNTIKKWSTIYLLKVLLDKPSRLIVRAFDDIRLQIKNFPALNQDFKKDKEDTSEESPELCRIIPNPLSSDHSPVELICKLRDLRKELLSKVFGQGHAIQVFIEGLYNSEVLAGVDLERKRPLGVFVFAGPPGVGKTYIAELSGSFLKKPFKRFDMTGYSSSNQHEQLIGVDPSYRGAQPGLLTDFVLKNPDAFLLFDEIEKAHLNTIQLFYQILDKGQLEDKHLKKEVNFRDTIIIFTTNAGKILYDNPNRIGISALNSNYHKRTVLSALGNEKNPVNGRTVFPQAICSRLKQGYRGNV